MMPPTREQLRKMFGEGIELCGWDGMHVNTSTIPSTAGNEDRPDATSPTATACEEADDALVCDGREWLKGDRCTVDQRTSVHGAYKRPPKLNLEDCRNKTEFDFFLAMYPSSLLQETYQLMTKGSSIRVGHGEFWLWVGLMMYMMVQPDEGDMSEYWLEMVPSGEVGVVHDLGQYGMPVQRFQKLKDSFVLPTYDNTDDPFNPIRRFVDEWNANLQSKLSPGELLAFDDSMALWRGLKAPGMLSLVGQRPIPTGWEHLTTVDVATGAAVHVEMYEGAERTKDKKWGRDHGLCCASLLRCTEPWHRSGRTVVCGPSFTSMDAASALMEAGLYFVGRVAPAAADSTFPGR